MCAGNTCQSECYPSQHCLCGNGGCVVTHGILVGGKTHRGRVAASAGTVAAEVEIALFQHGGGVTAEYKAKYRSLSFNLKDSNNPDLRRRVLSGEVAAKVRAACCTPSSPEHPVAMLRVWGTS